MQWPVIIRERKAAARVAACNRAQAPADRGARKHGVRFS